MAHVDAGRWPAYRAGLDEGRGARLSACAVATVPSVLQHSGQVLSQVCPTGSTSDGSPFIILPPYPGESRMSDRQGHMVYPSSQRSYAPTCPAWAREGGVSLLRRRLMARILRPGATALMVSQLAVV